jgi:hypothetical protein
MIKEHINEIILFFTGGGLAAMFNFLRDKRKDNTDEFKDLLNYMKEMLAERDKELEKFQQENDECREEISKLREELNELKSKLIVLESAHFDIPFPMWLKSLDGKMISLNTEYENHFLLPLKKKARDYIGKTDHEFWGPEIGKEYIFNDNMTLKSKNGYWSGTETIRINDEDHTSQWTIVKYVRYSGRTAIGIGGIAIPIFMR